MDKKLKKEGKEHSWKSEGHYTKDGKEWTGPQHAHNGQVMTGEKHTDSSQDLYHFKELPKLVQQKLLAKMKLKEDLRNWFSKSHPKGDWVRVGTDGEIKGDCAREPGEGKPKCMPRSKAHSMDKDDRATSARRKRREDPVADRKGKGGKPVMVKTDVKEDVQISKYEWGRPDGTAYLKAITPGEPGKTTKKNKTTNKYHYKAKIEENCGCEEDNDYDVLEMDHHVFSNEEIVKMENQIDDMEWEDLVGLEIYDEDELEDFESYDDDEESDIHDNIDILENLTIQGRMKRRFNARRNKQKLKVARMRASRRAADPARIKRRASRGARNMIKSRLARGRDIKTMPPAERARIEAMTKRFGNLVSRLAQRMVPVIRRNELKRLTSSSKKPQKAKKYKASSAKSQASKQKGKKFKVKKK